jgi:hypothetical protein
VEFFIPVCSNRLGPEIAAAKAVAFATGLVAPYIAALESSGLSSAGFEIVVSKTPDSRY